MAGRSNLRTAGRLGGVVATMLALSFAAVPFYDWFCRVTGYGGATATAAAAPEDAPRPEVVTIRFDANVAPGLDAVFRPLARTMDVRVGESGLAFYEFQNLSDRPISGTASFNVAPYSAGGYFAKLACFCFELQTLQPGERVEMPVSFFVDPAMLEDREAGDVRAITLSYTMHASDPPAETAALDGAGGAPRAIEN